MKPHCITIGDSNDTNTAEPGHKSSKIQTLIEVLRCELGRPGRSPTTSDNGLGPTKQWTPSYYAVYHNREAALLHFLRAGEAPDGNPTTQPLLCIAVAAGHVGVVKILGEAGANISAGCKHNGETPLHLAVKTGRDDILGALLVYNPDLNARTLITNETPLHYAARAAKSVSTVAVAALLKHGANYEAHDNVGCSPAEVAIQNGNLQATITIIRAAGGRSHKLTKEKQMLLKRIEKAQDRSSLGVDLVAQILEVGCPPDSTSLVEAIKMHDARLVRLILERGADPNRATASGLYPIFAAFNACSVPVVQALVDHRADVTLRNPHGPNVLQAALESPLSSDREALSEVFGILLSRGADAHTAYKDGATLLHHVVRPGLGSVKLIQQLIRHGINIDSQDRDGNTALHVAATSPLCVAILLKHGANPNLVNQKGLTPFLHATKLASGDKEPDLQRLLKASDIRYVDSTGETALHLAAQNGLYKTVRLLLQARADTTSTDSRKRTPLLLAVLNHQWAIVPLLAAQPGINSWDENGLTALHHIAMSTPKAPSTWNHIAAAAASFCEKGVRRSMRDQTGSAPLIQATKSLPEEGLPLIETLLFQKGPERSNCVGHEDHGQRNALYYAATLGKSQFVETLLKHGSPFSLNEWRPKRGPVKPNSAVNKKILKLFAEHEWIRRIAKLQRQSSTVTDASMFSKILPIRDLTDMLSMGLDPNALPKSKPTSSLLWALLEYNLSATIPPSLYLYDGLKAIFAFGARTNVMNQKPRRAPKTRNSQQALSSTHALTHIIEQFQLVDIELIKLLLDNGGKLSISSPLYDGRYPLHSAVRSNRIDIVDETIRRNSDVNCDDNQQRTPLFAAIQNGFEKIVDLLLSSGAALQSHDSEGNTPLHAAVVASNVRIVSFLLRSGAKACSENHKGLTPLACVSDKSPDTEKQDLVRMLRQAEERECRQLSQKSAGTQKLDKMKQPEVKKPAVNEDRKVLKKQQSAPIQPPQYPTTTNLSPTQKSTTTPLPIPKHQPPPVTKQLVPAPPRLAKQMLSIHYTPPPPKPAEAPIPPPKSSTNINQSLQKPHQTPRVDSGVSMSTSNLSEKPLPVLQRKKTSFDPHEDFSTGNDELESWLNINRMLDRL